MKMQRQRDGVGVLYTERESERSVESEGERNMNRRGKERFEGKNG